MPDQTLETTSVKLEEEFVARFGVPLEIHTEQGRNFQSDMCRGVSSYLH